MAVSERKIIVSGQSKYVPLTEQEKGSYLLRFYFTDLTTPASQSVNFEWEPDRKFFGRFTFCHGVYVAHEKLVHFNNELIHEERADALLLNHNAQCAYVDVQHVNIEAIAAQPASAITAIAIEKNPVVSVIGALITGLIGTLTNLDGGVSKRINLIALLTGQASNTPGSLEATDWTAITPRNAPGHPLDGFYYSMEGLSSGELTIRSFFIDDRCFIPTTSIPSSRNEGAPPPSSAGGVDVPGQPGGVPPSTGDGPPPVPGLPAPPSLDIPNPGGPPTKPAPPPPVQVPGRVYLVTVTFFQQGATRRPPPALKIAPISGVKSRVDAGGFRLWFYTDTPVPGGPTRENIIANDFVNDPFPERNATAITLTLSNPPGG
jgi:hypothetical protein